MIRILNSKDVQKALPMAAAIKGMKTAYQALSAGEAVAPQRSRLHIASSQADALFMPAYIPDQNGGSLAVKIVTLFPENIPAGLPLIHAAVLVMDAATGQMLAMLEGGALTAIRTGAGAGAATDMLARPESRTAAILGSGVQARTQLEAVCAVRPIETVRVYSPHAGHVTRFIEAMQTVVTARLHPAASSREVVRDADIICAATTSSSPVFEDGDIPAGAHINGVGSYTPAMIEMAPETIARAGLVAVDSRAACQVEAGEIIAAVKQGRFAWDQAVEIGEITAGNNAGRQEDRDITVFKSVGVAVQDAVAAGIALANAQAQGLGQVVDW